MPYCLQKLSSGKWVFLNRYYKPLGMSGCGFVNYENYAQKITGLGRATQEKLSHNGRISEPVPGDLSLWLYNDGCVPTQSASKMNAYMDKLKIISKLILVSKSDPE